MSIDGKAVTDGPFPESKEAIAGYWFIQADSLADAVEIAKGNPCLKYGETVEVRPILPERSSASSVKVRPKPLLVPVISQLSATSELLFRVDGVVNEPLLPGSL